MRQHNILITGARAPVALDLARQFSKLNYVVFTADSIPNPLTMASNCVKSHFNLPSPRLEFNEFCLALKHIITENNIKLIVPTCEEIFYLAKSKVYLPNDITIFCDSLDKLEILHNKYSFMKLQPLGEVQRPKLTTKIIIAKELHKLPSVNKYILKPFYSRFGRHILWAPGDPLPNLPINKVTPYLAQTFISGTEYSSYSVAIDGKLKAHVCYYSKYRIKNSSGVSYEIVEQDTIHEYVSLFVKKHNYTGQIGFDYIIRNNIVYVLECNPRAVSGLHLFPHDGLLASAILNKSDKIIIPNGKIMKISKIAALVFVKKRNIREFAQDMLKGQEVTLAPGDNRPFFYQLMSISSIIKRSILQRISILKSATHDIEYNGKIYE